MSQLRLYVDEDAGEQAVIDGLRSRGIDCLTTLEASRLGSADHEQLVYAISQQRVIYTFNVSDFARLQREYLEQKRSHFGIVVIPDQRYSIGEQIRCLGQFVNLCSAEDMLDRMEYL